MFMTGLARSLSFSLPDWLHFSRDRSSEAAAFTVDLIRDQAGIDALLHTWSALLGKSQSPECIYQSPAFYAFTAHGDHAAAAMPGVLCLKRASDDSVAALVPARMMRYPLQFRLGPVRLLTVRLPVVQLLGSVPMVATPLPRHLVYRTLLERFPAAQAVYMQAVPRELYGGGGGLRWNVVNGWRKCLGVDIEGGYDGYLKSLPSKKRYNMTRQIRLLEQEAGGLQTTAITAPAQAAQLKAALDALLDPTEASNYPSARYFERLAAHGLMQSYVIEGASGPVAVVLGTRYQSTWYVHNIFTAQAYAKLSPGTSAFLLTLKEASGAHAVSKVEFGYGSPNREFKSTHTAALRANTLVSRRLSVALLLKAHGWLQRANEGGSVLLRRVRRLKASAK